MNQSTKPVNEEVLEENAGGTGKVPGQFQIIVNIDTPALIMHPKKFADVSGRSVGVVGGWLDQGYLPTVKVGKYQMINMVLLAENLKKGCVL